MYKIHDNYQHNLYHASTIQPLSDFLCKQKNSFVLRKKQPEKIITEISIAVYMEGYEGIFSILA